MGPCDETVGRFCSWYGEGDWVPEGEAPEIGALRDELLAELDSLQALAAGDAWILGQRVWYRAEGGDWTGALSVARRCGPPQEAWWCAALAGLALHGLGRWQEAERAFDEALYRMDVERAWLWRVPVRAVDGDGRRVLEGLRHATPDSVAHVLDRLWSLSDPLYLVEGNDRRTVHLARWTVATLREGARTTYGISWGRDLEELLVRHGWEVGWERESPYRITDPDRVIGRKNPDGRDYLPPGAALADPAAAEPGAYVAGRARPRSLHAPPYAPVILPMEVQVAVFPRGQSFVVVAGHELPPDTTRRAREGIERPWMEPGDQAGMSDRSGLHLVDAGSGAVVASTGVEVDRGVLWLEAPVGAYVLSAESWSPSRRRAGRHRAGLDVAAVPEDIPVLSDLLLVDVTGREPTTLWDAAEHARVRPVVEEGREVGVVWEVTGLGFRREILSFELAVERLDRGVLRRIGGWLGLSDPERPLSLAWEEPGPEEPGPLLRYVALELPDVEPGRYAVRLRMDSAGRDAVFAERVFEVRSPDAPR